MQTYALAFCRLPKTHALQRCLLTSPSITGRWGIITMAKPLWTYTVVKLESCPHQNLHSDKLYSGETRTFCRYLPVHMKLLPGKDILGCLGWDLKYIKEQETCHPSHITIVWSRNWLVAQESRFQVSVLQDIWMSESCIPGKLSGHQTISYSEEQLPHSFLLDVFHFV